MSVSTSTRGVQFSPIEMEKRTNLRLGRISGDRNRLTEKSNVTLWFDLTQLDQERAEDDAVLQSAIAAERFSGFIASCSTAARLIESTPTSTQLVAHFNSAEELRACVVDHQITLCGREVAIVSSPNPGVLAEARDAGARTCLRAFVDDGASLHETVAAAASYDYLVVGFRDPTNIPLELIIATLQATNTVLIKEITDRRDVDDAIVTLGVMEVGAEGVLFTPGSIALVDTLKTRLDALGAGSLELSVGTVTESRPAGMGYRSCIDLATLFSPTEGMIVGSTSQGGILCCPEVFFLPYMELRPFRVNAGGVHSYVYGFEDRTDYMTELKSGAPVMVVDKSGRTRRACVGRMKTELRPIRLIEVMFDGGKKVSVLMQDDWHVRIFSADGEPLNITALRPGDKVLGYVTEPGRHVGIRVSEHILES